jgi:hypothetical protein
LRAEWVGQAHQLQLRAHVVGTQENYLSETFTVSIGQAIEWTLEYDLRKSNLAIRQLSPEEAETAPSARC